MKLFGKKIEVLKIFCKVTFYSLCAAFPILIIKLALFINLVAAKKKKKKKKLAGHKMSF